MEGYTPKSYGDSIADVYDEWYERISDISETVSLLAELAGGGRVLELGIGTGRIAIPLARRGVAVSGIDTSQAMLDRLLAKPGAGLVTALIGDMTAPFAGGPYDVVFVAYNTLFAVDSDDGLRRCFANAANSLTQAGYFVVEAFVPVAPDVSSSVEVKQVTVDRVVLSVSEFDPDHQRAHGQFVEFSESGGVRLRPWAVHYWTPAQLDVIANSEGFFVEDRYESWQRHPFTVDSTRHVSLYRRRATTPARPVDSSQTP